MVSCSSGGSSVSNSIFSTVQLSGGSGDSCGSVGSSGRRGAHRGAPAPSRSKSLERGAGTRILPLRSISPGYHHRHTRSLERNHKFRLDLRRHQQQDLSGGGGSRVLVDEAPLQQAPPPPGQALTPTHVPWTGVGSPPDGAGLGQLGQVVVCGPELVRGVGLLSLPGSSRSWVESPGMESGHAGGGGGSFINKPARGWLHPDTQLADEGICYGVRYIGCLEVNTSMKSLNFDTRSLIAKECISRVCEAAGLKTADRKRKAVKTIARILGERPMMEHAGSNVSLTITSTALTLTVLESGQIVACHDMPNISFASGGDPDTLDFIAYVAKDSRLGRACFVLECGGGLAQDVITTIGQAFELRFKEYLKRTPSVQYTSVKTEKSGGLNGEAGSWRCRDDPEYYNDLPGKVPPDLPPPPVPPLPQYSAADSRKTGTGPVAATATTTSTSTSPTPSTPSSAPSSAPSTASSPPPVTTPTATQHPLQHTAQTSTSHPTHHGKVSDLIDLSNETTGSTATLKSEPEYVNDTIIKQKQMMDQRDPFDMQPFSMQLSQLSGSGGGSSVSSSPGGPGGTGPGAVPTTGAGGGPPNKTLPMSQRIQLQREPWFHGVISRREAEQLLLQDGDFLVRESYGSAGQYVLTGMQNNTKKHLLLVDPEGVVRTKSRTFDNVSHLINYHRDNELPIVSAESALVLRNPVIRRNVR